jgi:hypothetical protein
LRRVLRDLLAKTHARVITPADDVGQALFDDDLDLENSFGTSSGNRAPRYRILGWWT